MILISGKKGFSGMRQVLFRPQVRTVRDLTCLAIGLVTCVLVGVVRAAEPARYADLALPVPSDQDPDDQLPSPTESLAKIRVPAGFHVSLFAAEPYVRQPIAMAFDDRGRLWVAECYSYPKWDRQKTDRIVIFSDTDNDGQFDDRQVFLSGITNLSSIEFGFGGVWITAAPHLLFVADRDRDDVPDDPPTVLLDGFADTEKVQHNIVNGLRWGPDGWLWGRHGILDESLVGPPGAATEQRVKINCGVWRFHPTEHRFEVVMHGTTNPWGLDWDEYGEAFITNCVIGHLWHVIPGGRYQRMYGQDYNPHSYELLAECSDHLHWQADKWQNARDGKEQSHFGGGHAHCGGMIYAADNWPAEYRGRIFTANVHGQRLNADILQRKGSGYVASHGDDLFFADSAWFRGVELRYGPDGGVFLLDWTDYGECHDADGVHRDSGRVYKVIHGPRRALPAFDLLELSNTELGDMLIHRNEWYARHARRILQERVADDPSQGAELRSRLAASFNATDKTAHRLRYLWALHAVGGASSAWCEELLQDPDEHVRTWAVRLLCGEHLHPERHGDALVGLANRENSAKVRLELASALQRLPVKSRLPLAKALVGNGEDAKDANIPLMLWYGIEPLVAMDSRAAAELIAAAKIPKLRTFIARRLVEK